MNFQNLVLSISLVSSFLVSAKTTTHFLPKENMQDLASKMIYQAKKEVYVSIYSFSSAKIRKALIDQAKKGLDVKLIVNDWKKEKTKEFIRPIVEAGASVRGTAKINHHKFILTDANYKQAALFNSSGNFSGSSRAGKYDENIIICDDCSNQIEAFTSEFESMYRFSNKVIGENDAVSPSAQEKKNPVGKNFSEALFTTVNMKPSFRRGLITFLRLTPKKSLGSIEKKLAEAIDNAKVSLKIATGHFRSKPLYDAVLRASKRGVKVEVVLDGQEYISRTKQAFEDKKVKECMKTKTEAKCYEKGVHFGRLLSKAVDVKFKYYSIRWDHSHAKQMHSKYMIIDDTTLYSGSYNWSNNAEFSSLENVAIYTKTKVLKSFIKNFNEVQNYGKGLFTKLTSDYKKARKSIAIVFDPMSLSVNEIDTLKREARKACPNLYGEETKKAYFCKI